MADNLWPGSYGPGPGRHQVCPFHCFIVGVLSNVQTRAIDSGNNENSDGKFKVYVGTIDGVRREVFNEVEGGDDVVPSAQNEVNPADPFGAYDDNNIISTENGKLEY